MSQVLFPVQDVIQMIEKGDHLILSGDETVLSQLPKGNWVGGTIPYFLADEGGVFSREKIYVNRMLAAATNVSIKLYDEENIPNVYTDVPLNGFGLIIIPAFSKTHLTFALNAPNFEGFATRPLIGWISGFALDETDSPTPLVFNGKTGKALKDGAIVMQATLPENKAAEIDILNIFEQGDGDTITFPEDGFHVTDAYVNGKKVNFAKYVTQNELDTRLPLVADYYGALINISFQNVDAAAGKVDLYAPVFMGVRYKHAKPIQDYVAQFTSHMPHDDLDQIFFSCNCILNYVYSELEGKKTADVTGPATFGEIAYQLLNQTLVYIKIHDV